MSARVLQFPFQPEAPINRQTEIAVAQRTWLAVEEALAGEWSDSILISLLATAAPLERGEILAELERRTWRKR